METAIASASSVPSHLDFLKRVSRSGFIPHRRLFDQLGREQLFH
jgi:hypothetical protein